MGTDKDGNVFNGADDDGSGTSTVLELAEAFAMAKEKGKGPEMETWLYTHQSELSRDRVLPGEDD